MTVAQQYIDAVNRADIDALMGLFARDGIIERRTSTTARVRAPFYSSPIRMFLIC